MPRPSDLLGAAFLLTVAASAAHAQVPSTPRALGAAGAWVAAARGHETVFLNPANLGLGDSPSWSLGLGGFTTSGTITGVELQDIPDLLAFDDLEDAERDELFADIPAIGIDGELEVRAPLAALQVGPVAVGLAYSVIGNHGVSRDLVELFLYGFEEGRTDYDMSTTTGNRANFWDLAVGYGQRVGSISFGVTGHYLRGGTLLRSWVREPRIDLISRDIEVGYAAAYVEGGNGFAVDLGAAYQPSTSLTLSAAVTNAYSRIDWSDELRIRDLILTRVDFESEDADGLLERYRDSDRAVTPGEQAILRGLTATLLQEEAQLPSVVRVGANWRPLASTQISTSWSESLTDGRLAGAWDRNAGIGLQQRLLFLTLRAGMATNFDGGSLLSAGLSLGGSEIGLAKLQESEAGREGWMLSVGMSMGR